MNWAGPNAYKKQVNIAFIVSQSWDMELHTYHIQLREENHIAIED